MRTVAALIGLLAAAGPVLAQAPETALRPLARPGADSVAEAPLRPVARAPHNSGDGIPAIAPTLAVVGPEAPGTVPDAMSVATAETLRPNPRTRIYPPVMGDSGAWLTSAVLPPVPVAHESVASAQPLTEAALRPNLRTRIYPPVMGDSGTWLTAAVLPTMSPPESLLPAQPSPGAMSQVAADDLPGIMSVPAPPAVLEARLSTRNILVVPDRLVHMEEALDRLFAPLGDGPALSEPVAAVLRLPPTSLWNGPQPALRGAPVAPMRPEARPAVYVPPPPPPVAEVLAALDTRPELRSEEFELIVAARIAPMIYTQQIPPELLPTISPYAVAEALRPEPRSEDFEVMAAAAPAPLPAPGPGRPLAMGAGLCGVAILSGNVLGHVSGPGQCGVSDAVEVTAVGGIRLSTGVTMDCTTATALANWVQNVAHPAVGGTGGGLSRIDVGGGYTCRGRNNQPGARLSEHAFGRAIDIMGFTLRDGTRLTVLNNWGNSILRQMHRGACGVFGTVLGPDANRYHRDHFHFDTARYRSGSYCQ